MKSLTLAMSLLFATMLPAVAEKVPVERAEKLIGEGVQILDVRTLKEWNEGHLKGATRIDILADGFDEKVAKQLDAAKPVLVYCRVGGRSAKAAKKLRALGFDRVFDLEGGILAWRKAGKEVVQ